MEGSGGREGGERKEKEKLGHGKKEKNSFSLLSSISLPLSLPCLPCTASSTTAVEAATTCHAPLSASAASCPGSQPAYPESKRKAPALAPPEETREFAEGRPPA